MDKSQLLPSRDKVAKEGGRFPNLFVISYYVSPIPGSWDFGGLWYCGGDMT